MIEKFAKLITKLTTTENFKNEFFRARSEKRFVDFRRSCSTSRSWTSLPFVFGYGKFLYLNLFQRKVKVTLSSLMVWRRKSWLKKAKGKWTSCVMHNATSKGFENHNQGVFMTPRPLNWISLEIFSFACELWWFYDSHVAHCSFFSGFIAT